MQVRLVRAYNCMYIHFKLKCMS